MTISKLEMFSYERWYPDFSEVTIESQFFPIPNDVVEYLRADKLVLPTEAVFARDEKPNDDSEWDDADETPELVQPSFPDFSKKLKDAISHLGGSVFIKLNWSAPTDASWITADKTLKCTNLEDIYLLLKSSELIANDLSHDFKIKTDKENFVIVLKRWQDVHPGSEYRCFVVQNKLVGITQRDHRAFYKHIVDSKFDIIEDITNFHQEHIKDKFALTSYVFDVVRQSKDRVSLLDFSPLDRKVTKPILFTWKELHQKSNNRVADPEFRYLGEEPGHQPNYYGVPHDVVDLCTRQSHLSLMEYVTEQVQAQLGENDENKSSTQQ